MPHEQEFIDHFDDNAEYHKAVKGITNLMECKCNTCDQYHVGMSHFIEMQNGSHQVLKKVIA